MDKNIETNNLIDPFADDQEAVAAPQEDGVLKDTDDQKTDTAEQINVDAAKAVRLDSFSQGPLEFETRIFGAKRKIRIHDVVINAFLMFVVAALFFLIVFKSVFIYCPVSQSSMFPTLLDGDRVLLTKTTNIKTDEIFVFKSNEIDAETGKRKNLIKRAVGTGGDRLLFAHFGKDDQESYTEVFLYRDSGSGWVLLKEDYRNKEKKHEDKPMVLESIYMENNVLGGFAEMHVYAAEDDQTAETFDITAAEENGLLVNKAGDSMIITIDEGWYFALGDNRNNSADSRRLGLVDKNTVQGKLWAKIPQGTISEKILRWIYGDT